MCDILNLGTSGKCCSRFPVQEFWKSSSTGSHVKVFADSCLLYCAGITYEITGLYMESKYNFTKPIQAESPLEAQLSCNEDDARQQQVDLADVSDM